mmetsp:Transcript_3896/g.14713  ORF Transcript_3896/g.14713 Transcript_3896/m.14713 type:complete len:430 (-) Transcript_3896:1477-2766(-)
MTPTTPSATRIETLSSQNGNSVQEDYLGAVDSGKLLKGCEDDDEKGAMADASNAEKLLSKTRSSTRIATSTNVTSQVPSSKMIPTSTSQHTSPQPHHSPHHNASLPVLPPNFQEMILLLLRHEIHSQELSSFTLDDFRNYLITLKKYHLLLNPLNLKCGVAQRRKPKNAVSSFLARMRKSMFWCEHWHSILSMCKHERLAIVARYKNNVSILEDVDEHSRSSRVIAHMVNSKEKPARNLLDDDFLTSLEHAATSLSSEQKIEYQLLKYDRLDPHLLIHKFRDAALCDGHALTFYVLKKPDDAQLHEEHDPHRQHRNKKEMFHYLEHRHGFTISDCMEICSNQREGTLCAIYTGQLATQYLRVDIAHNFRIADHVYRISRPEGRIVDVHFLWFPNDGECFFQSIELRVKTKRIFVKMFVERELEWEKHAE